jgi:hypothetical protein
LFTVVATQCLLATSDDDAISIHAMSSPADIEVHWHLDRASAENLRQRDVPVATVLSLSVVHDHGKLGSPVFAKHQWRGDRLTLWIHPGRIKQGVNLRNEFGPVLKPRRRYQLLITRQIRNLAGLALEQTHVKEFTTSEEDHTRPDASRWKLSDVRTGTRSPLVVKLDEPLDRALLMRLITVVSEDNEIAGSINLAGEECVWTFIPTHPWPDGQLELRINERLENLAGNTPARVFDTDLTVPPVIPPVLRIPIKNLNGR